MSLLSITDLNELLSWPINHVTYYTHQPVTHQIFLIMSRLVNSTSSLCLIICLNINKTFMVVQYCIYLSAINSSFLCLITSQDSAELFLCKITSHDLAELFSLFNYISGQACFTVSRLIS